MYFLNSRYISLLNHVLEWQKLQDGETNNNNEVAIVKTELPLDPKSESPPKSTRNKRHTREMKDFSTLDQVPRKFSLNNHLLMVAPTQQPKTISDDFIKKEEADDVFFPTTVEHPLQHQQVKSFLYSNGTSLHRNFHLDGNPDGLLQRQNSLPLKIDGKFCGEVISSNSKPNTSLQGQSKVIPTKTGRGKRKSRSTYQVTDMK